MDAILNNPFRILGLPTTASDKEIAKRVSDLLIYAEMGKRVYYETDFPFLGEIDRSVESIKHAAQKIEIPENKIFYSLLCFDLIGLDKESIEFLKLGDFIAALKVLKNEFENNSPIVYRSYNGQNINNLLKNFNIVENNNYSIQKVSPIPTQSHVDSLFEKQNNHKDLLIKHNDGFIDLPEGCSNIVFTDKYQISCQFKWLLTSDTQEKSLGLGFINNANEKCFVLFSQNGLLRFFKSTQIEFERKINNDIFFENKFNYLTLQKYNNYLEIKLNDNSLLKIDTPDLFHSSFLCFSGQQKILIERLFISGLERKGLGEDIEINEKTFSYSKNISLIYLLLILKNKKIDFNLIHYFDIIGNFFKRHYFISYVHKIISDNYQCNFFALTDIFIREFYFSIYQSIDPNEEDSQLKFYNSFKRLSDNAEKKVKDIILGSKPYAFENFIKEISLKRIKEPNKAYDLACDLKNEATYFLNWYSQFYGFGSLISKSISDKIGSEILECSIVHYNATNPKEIALAKQSLKLLTWASDFAFNQELRDRINKNISTLLMAYEITEYKIIDFVLKDITRFTESVTYKGPHIDDKSKKTSNIESIYSQKELEIISQKQDRQSQESGRQRQANESKRQKSIKVRIHPLKILKNIVDVIKISFLTIFGIMFRYILFAAVVFGIIYLIDNSGNESKITSKWKGNKLENGSSPYDQIFGKGIFDYHSKCWITFKNGNSTDAIACLVNYYTGTTVRNEYIRAGTDFTMSNLPVGVYKVKVFYGNDWNPEKTLNQGMIKGAFDTGFSFSISDNSKDLINVNTTETNEGVRYTTGKITLYTVNNGNMNKRNINSDEFFN